MKTFKKTKYNSLTISGRGVVTDIYKVIEEKKDYYKVCLIETTGDIAIGGFDTIIWKKQIGKSNHAWKLENLV